MDVILIFLWKQIGTSFILKLEEFDAFWEFFESLFSQFDLKVGVYCPTINSGGQYKDYFNKKQTNGAIRTRKSPWVETVASRMGKTRIE